MNIVRDGHDNALQPFLRLVDGQHGDTSRCRGDVGLVVHATGPAEAAHELAQLVQFLLVEGL